MMFRDILDKVIKYEGKELREIFDIIVDKNPGLSSYICFSKTVKGRKYDPAYVEKWFRKLVDKDDYDKDEYGEVLAFLQKYTHSTR